MTRSGRTPLRRSTQVVASVLIYCLTLSIFVLPKSRTAQASLREALNLKAAPSPAPSPVPSPAPSAAPSATPVSTPSPTPEPVEIPTPEPTPIMPPVTAPTPTQGVPAPNLPNLDTLRNVQPEEPELPDANPSTLCSPGQPDCNQGTPTPTPSAQALRAKNIAPPTDRLIPSLLDQSLAVVKTNHFTRGSRKTSLLLRPQPQTGGSYDDFVMARLDPNNRVGTGGEDILSRNFNWSIPLVSMAGRAGLNLGLSLSYNSLVWMRSGSYITYDADNGYPTPGFRLGFPAIYGTHYNSQTGTYGYLMLMPSGARVELRRIGSTNLYEAADSSYLQLTDNGNGTLLVRSTDGTQLSYTSTTNGYRCTQVKDRNGNYLSISNNIQGRIQYVTDTLGRVFTFNYDTNNNLTSISQTRGSSQYTWVTFSYTTLTLQTNFTGLTLVGTQSGTTLPVLSQVGLPDGTFYRFSYNSWGQVYKTTYYAADSATLSTDHVLNYVSYNLPLDATTAQTDCPRFTQRKDWAENWNNGNEAVTNYTAQVSTSWQMPGGGSQSGTFCQRQTPDGVYYNVYFHSSGWDEGMPVLVNTWANNDQQQLVLQRQETSTYTQDNTSVGYILNPRVTETNIYDPSGNHKRVSVSYSSFTLTYSGNTLTYYLPSETKEYAADASSILRTTQTDYNLGTDYTSRRIFGLASQKRVYDTANSNALLSKVDYIYDDGGECLVQQGTPVQHDTTNYGTSFVTGRGNLTRIRKWDVINISQSVEAKFGYNTTGSPVFLRNPLQTATTQSNIIYTDSFSDGQSRNTYAYPTETTIKDTVGTTPSVTISNKTQFSYDLGAVTRAEGPPPAGQTQGAIITNAYDSADRLYLSMNAINGAYTYIIYPTSSNVIQTYRTVRDTQTLTVSAKLFDGAGHMRATASEHPGSTGGYIGQYFTYDVMGRVTATSNPTEIYGSWQPAGDDAAGWVWSYQSYDWKGRPRVTTNQDGTTKEATYSACGCAGGEVVTMRDEVNRYAKVYHDVLGRVSKTEELNWDQTVYRTATNTYNGRDQVMQIVMQQGSSGTGQTTIMTYDGYARLRTQHRPENDSGAVTTYDYYNDDALQRVTDARGATTNYSYNNRHLITDISYTSPTGSNIIVPHAIGYAYDAAGNRISMTDSMGSVSYAYDPLSRLTSETRTIDEISKSYTFNYGYNVGGELTSLSDPNDTNRDLTYTYNQAGALTTVTGNGFASLTQPYASNLQYRAWGTLKHLAYGNGKNLDYQYSSRLQTSRYEVSGVMGATFQYNADGLISFVGDLYNPTSDTMLWDRSYSYDQVSRLVAAKSGAEAHTPPVTTSNRPYNETFGYDVWGNLTSRAGQVWENYMEGVAAQYTNNRRSDQYSNWAYDADGRPTVQDALANTYDASGRKIKTADVSQSGHPNSMLNITQTFDGDRQIIKQQENTRIKYFIHSTALGGEVVSEIALVASTSGPNTWKKKTGFVYGGGVMLAVQTIGTYGNAPMIEWRHQNTVTGSQRWTLFTGQQSLGKETELDPLGLNAGLSSPGSGAPPSGSGESELVFPRFGDIMNGSTGCTIDGMMVSCDAAIAVGTSEGGGILPEGVSWSGNAYYDTGKGGIEGIAKYDVNAAQAGIDKWGMTGMVPVGTRFVGNGFVEGGKFQSLDNFWLKEIQAQAKKALNDKNIFPNEKARYEAAVDNLVKHLKDNSACAQLFGGLRNVYELFRGTNVSFVPGNEGLQTVGHTIRIDDLGPFMSKNGKQPGSWKPLTGWMHFNTIMIWHGEPDALMYANPTDDVQGAAFLLAHELGHRAGIYGKWDLDGGGKVYDPTASGRNNDKIQAACFPELVVKPINVNETP